ncbi:unnamed protein product [Didymodactylos carnosus]|uniref:Uncharacterized protein n=1 Tax=Didymodactylos carnosus TaxID=1234261 RepID=A0A814FA45_9BILA|nr:unnamed protein product [Didymodactylos carnosus]CAF3752974.1 unnamed protein product [Didymodactylos carnosus]
MISGFARAGAVLQEQKYTKIAEQALGFIRQNMFKNDRLLRACYIGDNNKVEYTSSLVNGFLEDYSYVIQSAIDLYETNFDSEILEFAYKLQMQQNDHFWDKEKLRYLSTDGKDESIILRLSEDHDGAEPSPNSISTLNLIRLNQYFNDQTFSSYITNIFKSYGKRLEKAPMVMPALIRAYDIYTYGLNEIIILSPSDDQLSTNEFIRLIQTSYLPNTIVLYLNSDNNSLFKYNQVSKDLFKNYDKKKINVHICKNFQCELPITTVEEFEKKLKPYKR